MMIIIIIIIIIINKDNKNKNNNDNNKLGCELDSCVIYWLADPGLHTSEIPPSAEDYPG